MSKPNAQTQHIVDKLVNEGLLLRNKGTNSIKSVKVEIAKFSDTFVALQKSMSGISGSIQAQSKLDVLNDERQFKLDKLSSKEQEEYRESETANVKRQQKLDTLKLKADEKAALDRDKKDLKIFGKGGIFSTALSDTFNVLKKALFFGVVGAIGYEVLAGAIEALAPKIFGKDVELPTLFDGFSKAGTAFGKISQGEWDGFAQNIKFLSTPAIQLGLGYAAAKGTGAVASAAVQGVSTALTFKALSNMITPKAADLAEGVKTSKISPKMIRGGLAGLVFAGLFAAIDPVVDFIRSKTQDMSPEEIANTEAPASMTAAGLAGAASIASLFFPGGILARAGVSVAAFLLGATVKAIDHAMDDDQLPNKIEKVYESERRSSNQLNELLDLREQALQLGHDPAVIDADIKKLKEKIAKDRAKFRGTFAESVAEDQESIDNANSKLSQLFGESLDEYRERKFKNNARARNSVSDETLMKRRQEEIDEQTEILNLNKQQMQATRETGASYGFTDEQMGLAMMGETLMSLEKRDGIREDRRIEREEREKKQIVENKNEEFQAYLKKHGIDFEGSYTDAVLQDYNQRFGVMSGNYGSPINIINKSGDTVTPINLSVGGAKTSTSILQGFHSGQAPSYSAFPGFAG